MTSAVSTPSTMNAVCLDDSGRLVIRNVPVPVPRKGEVLIKISAAPVNPSDISRIKHLAPAQRTSFIGGIEGCGVVVSGGSGILPRLWLGRRVACTSANSWSGTWAEYMVTSAMTCIPLPSKISDEQGSMLLVNPMTAVAFLKIVREGHHKAFINNAAFSSLGKMIAHLARENGIPLIQIVRNERHREQLTAGGSAFVLNSSSEGFDDNLRALAAELNATLALDAIGGEMTRKLMLSLPFGGTVMVYGNLSGEQPLADHRSLVTDDRKVRGFYLVNWLKQRNIVSTLSCLREVRDMLVNDITIPVKAKYPLAQAQKAIEAYLSDMSAGKILLIS